MNTQLSPAFQYYVRRFSGLVSDIGTHCPEGGFYSMSTAKAFADSLHDGLNFVIIFNSVGQTVHINGPQSR